MRVLVYEQWHQGHHYKFLEYLLPCLSSFADDVVVSITEQGYRSAEFGEFLGHLEGCVRFEPILQPSSESFPLDERWRLYARMRGAIERFRPDYVLVPTGDAQSTLMGVGRLCGRGGLPGRCRGEVGIHFGLGPTARSIKQRGRDIFHQLNLTVAGWQRLHFVNSVFYEQIRSINPLLARRAAAQPIPVAPSPRLTKVESRRRLGFPETGRYVGFAGSIDRRKAIDEMLNAFRAAARGPEDRVLLAGKMDPLHRRHIQRNHTDLIADGRLLTLDCFLDATTYQTALTALDLVCLPYPGFGHASSTLLEGVAAGRPILVNDYGWSRSMVKRFELGWTCDILNHDAFSRTLRVALDESSAYRESKATARLLAFHSPENFEHCWLEGMRRAAGGPCPTPRTWEWVLEWLPPERRYLL